MYVELQLQTCVDLLYGNTITEAFSPLMCLLNLEANLSLFYILTVIV